MYKPGSKEAGRKVCLEAIFLLLLYLTLQSTDTLSRMQTIAIITCICLNKYIFMRLPI